ncbi:MAG: hypothetical protein E2P02_12065 [Acidobacteria bacterium]|nr:MAG: hypothetical protein E2P02_12065 [Acidobacteriota bacterium]
MMLRLKQYAGLLVILLSVSCSGGEQEVVNSFLAAIQSGNEAAAKAVSVVEYLEKVESWEIVEVGAESTEPFALAELDDKRATLSRERRLVTEQNDYFLQDHKDAFEEYEAKTKDEPDYEFSGEMAEFQKEWEERRSKQEEGDRVAIGLGNEISRLRSAAGLSVNVSVNAKFVGEVFGKKLTLRVNDGSTEKTHTFTLRKFNIVDTTRNLSPIGRWVITDIN